MMLCMKTLCVIMRYDVIYGNIFRIVSLFTMHFFIAVWKRKNAFKLEFQITAR